MCVCGGSGPGISVVNTGLHNVRFRRKNTCRMKVPFRISRFLTIWGPARVGPQNTHETAHTHKQIKMARRIRTYFHKHTNTHPDRSRTHTHTHLLLPMAVFALKARTKTHTYLVRESTFLGVGGSRNNSDFCLSGGPRAPQTRFARALNAETKS